MYNINEMLKQDIFKNFKKISKIPRGSHNEEKISEFLLEFGKSLGLETYKDEHLNIIIKKASTSDSNKTVMLQGHMDMVCEKERKFDFDFLNDGVELIVEGDYLTANKTTLGADNGIAIAYTMSILESDQLKHPNIVALFTANEEDGMGGIIGFNPEKFPCDIIINIDAEEEGKIFTSCAGAVRTNLYKNISFEKNKYDKSFSVIIGGLLGGHSGMEIDKNRISAFKVTARLLSELNEIFDISISDIVGGTSATAIPRSCEVLLNVNSIDVDIVLNKIKDLEKKYFMEFDLLEKGFNIEISEISNCDKYIIKDDFITIIDILTLIDQGINTMSLSVPGVVESSTNLGLIKITDNEIFFGNVIRSAEVSIKEYMIVKFQKLARLTNSTLKTLGDYPEWKFKKESYIRVLMVETYEKLYEIKPIITSVHCGLECGYLSIDYPNSDMVSIGPNLKEVHTTNEKMDISSAIRVYEFLKEVLSKVN